MAYNHISGKIMQLKYVHGCVLHEMYGRLNMYIVRANAMAILSTCQ